MSTTTDTAQTVIVAGMDPLPAMAHAAHRQEHELHMRALSPMRPTLAQRARRALRQIGGQR